MDIGEDFHDRPEHLTQPRWTGWALPVGIVTAAGLLVIVVVGVRYMSRTRSAPTYGSPHISSNVRFIQPSPAPTPVDTSPTSTSDISGLTSSTANWKTYTDSKYDISFKYPSDARVGAQMIPSMLSFEPSDGITIEPLHQEPYLEWYSFALVVRDNRQGLDAKTIVGDFIEDIKKNCSAPACNTPKTILDTLRQYKNGSVDGYIFHIGAETDSVMVVQARNGKTYIFRMTGNQGYVTNYGLEVLDQILSTFRFLP